MMSDSRSYSDLDKLHQEVESLRAQNAQLQHQLQGLEAELQETNQGVVALYSELDMQAISLREATELKSRFLSYMSHEFRTPLSAIRSITKLLLDRMDGPLTAEQGKQVNFIQGSAVELTDMVNDLLDLAKIEAGRVSISPAWFEMVDLFAALRGMFKPLVETSPVALLFEEPEDLPRLYTDDKQLSHILRNFISNAIKFTPEGEIRISARNETNDRITFSVADTGIGIEAEHQATIFQEFVQVESPIQRKFRGTGLGLSLCKKMAALLGGCVGMSSAVGVGSTFWVTIPVRYANSEPDGTKEKMFHLPAERWQHA